MGVGGRNKARYLDFLRRLHQALVDNAVYQSVFTEPLNFLSPGLTVMTSFMCMASFMCMGLLHLTRNITQNTRHHFHFSGNLTGKEPKVHVRTCFPSEGV